MNALRHWLARLWAGVRRFAVVVIALIAMPIASGWVGDVAREAVSDVDCVKFTDWMLLVGGLLILLVSVVVAVREGQRLLVRPTVIDYTEPVTPRRVLIALLSLCPDLKEPAGPQGPHWEVTDREGKNPITISGKSLDELVDPDARLHNMPWQQTLRAASAHPGLERLVLIGSRRGSGTGDTLAKAKRFFSQYFNGKVIVLGEPEAFSEAERNSWTKDFENLDETQDVLRRAVAWVKKREEGYTDKDIVIDVTGGQKTASIAAVLVTLDRRDLTFQYVGTHSSLGRVFGFNVVTDARTV